MAVWQLKATRPSSQSSRKKACQTCASRYLRPVPCTGRMRARCMSCRPRSRGSLFDIHRMCPFPSGKLASRTWNRKRCSALYNSVHCSSPLSLWSHGTVATTTTVAHAIGIVRTNCFCLSRGFHRHDCSCQWWRFLFHLCRLRHWCR